MTMNSFMSRTMSYCLLLQSWCDSTPGHLLRICWTELMTYCLIDVLEGRGQALVTSVSIRAVPPHKAHFAPNTGATNAYGLQSVSLIELFILPFCSFILRVKEQVPSLTNWLTQGVNNKSQIHKGPSEGTKWLQKRKNFSRVSWRHCTKARDYTCVSLLPAKKSPSLTSVFLPSFHPYCCCLTSDLVPPTWNTTVAPHCFTVLSAPSRNTSSPSSTWLPRWSFKVQIGSCSLCCLESFKDSHGLWDGVPWLMRQHLIYLFLLGLHLSTVLLGLFSIQVQLSTAVHIYSHFLFFLTKLHLTLLLVYNFLGLLDR